MTRKLTKPDEALTYVVPVSHEEEYIARAISVVGAYIEGNFEPCVSEIFSVRENSSYLIV